METNNFNDLVYFYVPACAYPACFIEVAIQT